MRRIGGCAVIAALAVTYLASPLSADEVVIRSDNFGPDFAFVDEFLSLNWPEYYRPERPIDGVPEITLDDVNIGRYDVDGDGEAELFLHIRYVRFCGTAGCPTYVFERNEGVWTKVSGMTGGRRMRVWTDPETGYNTVYGDISGFRWTGEVYEYIGEDEAIEVGAQAPPDFAAEGGCIERQKGGFGNLLQYVGTSKHLCFLYDPRVKAAIEALTGSAFFRIRANMGDARRIGYSEGNVVIWGSRRRDSDDGRDETAMVIVSPYDGQVHVGIYSKGVRTIYSGETEWARLPSMLRAWSFGHFDPAVREPPADLVRLVGPNEEE